jgi:hypothetical protein
MRVGVLLMYQEEVAVGVELGGRELCHDYGRRTRCEPVMDCDMLKGSVYIHPVRSPGT